MPRVVLARQLRTARQLGVEVARLLAQSARREAYELVDARKPIPPPDDMYARLVYAFAQPLLDAQRERDRARSRAVFSTQMREQRKEERAREMQKGTKHNDKASQADAATERAGGQ